MTLDAIWPFAVVAAVVVAIFCFTPVHRWSWVACWLAIPSLTIASLELEFILRAIFDPTHESYRTAAAFFVRGGLVAASCVSASLIIRNRPGPAMLIVAAITAFQLVHLAFPLVDKILANSTAASSRIGGYDVPYWAGTGPSIALVVLPFLLALAWAIQRTVETE